MAIATLVIGLVLAILILSAIPQLPNKVTRGAAVATAILVLIAFALFSSVHYVGMDEVGVVNKNAMGPKLPSGQILATNGEMGPQAKVLPPGWHFGYWPVIYTVKNEPIVDVKDGFVGILTANDGKPLPPNESFAPEWSGDEVDRMSADAEYFLTTGNGYKGPQSSVLTPGKYRINPKLFIVEQVAVTEIEKATVAVIKSNVGDVPDIITQGDTPLVDIGQRGIWNVAYGPQRLYLNTKAYNVTIVHTDEQTIFYGKGGKDEQIEITVFTSDGFEISMDVRVEYEIKSADAPTVVVRFGGDDVKLQKRLASAVRAIFRNNAQQVKALDYIKERSQQESATTTMLAPEMQKYGISIKNVRIGNIQTGAELEKLLITQKEREIAVQEVITLKQQQLSAEEMKNLNKTKQEAEEEMRLATAMYDVQIAEQDKEKKIIEANAEAESISIKAKAQAEAYKIIAEQIGKSNAALVELLKIIGETGINITPRVMVTGGGKGGDMVANSETTALIGTMLDSMLQKTEEE